MHKKKSQLHPTESYIHDLFQDPAFKLLQKVCNSVFECLHAKGVDAEMKATPVMNSDDERLWTSGHEVLKLTNPTGLLKPACILLQ